MSLATMRALEQATCSMINFYQQFFLSQKPFSIETFEEADSPIQFYSEDWQKTVIALIKKYNYYCLFAPVLKANSASNEVFYELNSLGIIENF